MVIGGHLVSNEKNIIQPHTHAVRGLASGSGCLNLGGRVGRVTTWMSSTIFNLRFIHFATPALPLPKLLSHDHGTPTFFWSRHVALYSSSKAVDLSVESAHSQSNCFNYVLSRTVRVGMRNSPESWNGGHHIVKKHKVDPQALHFLLISDQRTCSAFPLGNFNLMHRELN